MAGTVPKAFAQVLGEEREEIKRARILRGTPPPESDVPTETEPPRLQFAGLAFSGGGIRSATFNLGVLQGLAELGLLSIFDYLSTVSGGGYIGTWFTAWIRHKSLTDVEQGLTTERSGRSDNQEPHEIRFLREYSNYLTPKLGLASGDTWAFVGSYIRNLLLNQIVLGLVLVALLLLPRPFVLYFWRIAGVSSTPWKVPVVVAVLLCIALGTTLANLSSQAQLNLPRAPSGGVVAAPAWIDTLVVLPILVALWLLWAWWWSAHLVWKADGITTWGLGVRAGLCFVAIWVVGWVGGEYVRWLVRTARGEAGMLHFALEVAQKTLTQARFPVLKIILWAGPAGVVGGLLVVALTAQMQEYVELAGASIPDWQVVSWGFPIVVLIFLFMQTLHIGFVGQGFTEDAREWWGRLGGVLSLATIALSSLFFISLDGPWLIAWMGAHHPSSRWILTTLWATITGAGLTIGKTPAKPNSGSRMSRNLIAKIAPPVFVLGLLLILSSFTENILKSLIDLAHILLGGYVDAAHSFLGQWPITIPNPTSDWDKIAQSLDGCLWFYIVGFSLLALFLSWRTGINRFSMHSLYRNRLVRCYLGASNEHRNPQPFTGMDPEDDSIVFGELLAQGIRPYSGPYPIYNTALNLVSSKDLAWQQRKAASFVFTPLNSGFEFVDAKGNTVSALQGTDGLEKKLKLGLAMAISGAAASPNMGSHSSPALSFLMTVFNVRLGWWLGNPLYPKKWGNMGPKLGLFYLFNELTGRTDDESKYVYLSDGGHFENLAIYELVRRQCRFIIVCDSGEDPALHFGDLGNAIEKCRTDFGVDIEIDVEPLRHRKDSDNSKWHCAVGTIHYEKVYEGVPSGTLLYLKSTLTGDEPTDVRRYADECPAFPHQSTADQWFNESQFESYRALGRHIVQSTIGVIGDQKELKRLGVEGMFVKLRQYWFPPSHFVESSFTKHTATYTSLLEKMRTGEHLKFLDAQVYPEWPNLMGHELEERRAAIWMPDDPSERRAGFYFCNEIIQLMEDAYLDLNLEADFDHPDNRGWMNLFRHWSWSGMFCATWAISAGIYGARFQGFCERRLDLRPGKVRLCEEKPLWQPGKSESELKSIWSDTDSRSAVDFWEAELIWTFVGEGWCGPADVMADEMKFRRAAALPQLHIVPFKMVVASPREDVRKKLQFNVGFAILRIPDPKVSPAEIVYFRIQDHLRKMGLARAALSELMKAFGRGLQNGIHATPCVNAFRELAGGASKWEAYPTREAALTFRNLFESVKLRESQRIKTPGDAPKG